MPSVTFLEAERPLVKSYSLDSEGKLVKESYPKVWEFTSHTFEYNTLQQLATLMRDAAAKGWCMLKGKIQQELTNESRAGSTDPDTPTYTIVLDLDRPGQITTPQEALEKLGIGDIGHIVQYSASYGVEPEKGCTCHIVIQLARPMMPSALKQWLIGVNLRVPELRSACRLTRTANAISWALDISTCQNDKLIYIAAPVLGDGVVGMQGERIQVVSKAKQYLDPSSLIIPTEAENRKAQNELLEGLRRAASLPPREWKTITKGGLEVLKGADPTTITGFKRERGFTYFNLNGGDSWGYYHPDGQPEIIHNFKGEPLYLTKDLLPGYWSNIQLEKVAEQAKIDEKVAEIEAGVTDVSKPQTIVFRDFKTAIYYNGFWDPANNKLTLARAASETQLQHFLVDNGLPEIGHIPIWNLEYNPESLERIDIARKTFNTFVPSKYMVGEYITTTEIPPVIRKILEHAVGTGEVLEHHLNWLACMLVYRTANMTAYVLHGGQGTGKGLYVHKVLTPLLGVDNVTVRRMEELEDKFNEYIEHSILVVFDEAQISETRRSQMVMANLKNQITEPQITIRKMHTAAYSVRNYCSYMFLSNRPDPVSIEVTDRRFNVGTYQPYKIPITDAEIEAIPGELAQFAAYLRSRAADKALARSVLVTEERAEMIRTSTNSIEATSIALKTGDLGFFWDALPAGEVGALSVDTQMNHDAYVKLIHGALRAEFGIQRFTRNELQLLYQYNCGDIPTSPAKFTSMLRHHQIKLDVMRVNGKLARGFEVHWKMESEWLRVRLSELSQQMPKPRLAASTVS